VGRRLIKIKANEGDESNQGNEEGSAAGQGKETGPPAFAKKPEAQEKGKGHSGIKQNLRRNAGQRDDSAADSLNSRGKEGPAAGSDYIRLETPEVSALDEGFRENQGSEEEKQQILLANQRVIIPPVVHKIND